MSLLMVRKSAPAHAADAAPKFRVGQEVIVKTKYTDPYRARIVGLWDMSKNGPYDEQGYLIKNIKGGGVESMPEHALSLATAKDSAADKTEKIANDSEIVALWQVLGDAKAYLREGKKNHNVKNVLAAAIKAAEKENPNDRSVAEAKKVLAQFDAAADAGVPNDLAFAVGAIENAIENYSKTFSRYEDNLEEKDFKRYNAIFHAAVNMHRAIQSA